MIGMICNHNSINMIKSNIPKKKKKRIDDNNNHDSSTMTKPNKKNMKITTLCGFQLVQLVKSLMVE